MLPNQTNLVIKCPHSPSNRSPHTSLLHNQHCHCSCFVFAIYNINISQILVKMSNGQAHSVTVAVTESRRSDVTWIYQTAVGLCAYLSATMTSPPTNIFPNHTCLSLVAATVAAKTHRNFTFMSANRRRHKMSLAGDPNKYQHPLFYICLCVQMCLHWC